MSLEHFVKHMACNTTIYLLAMHEHMEICLNTGLKCHKGPTQIHTKQMGHNLIKILKTFAQKQSSQPPFPKNPQFKNPKLISAYSKKKNEKNVKKTYL